MIGRIIRSSRQALDLAFRENGVSHILRDTEALDARTTFEEDGRSGYNRARTDFEEDGRSGYNRARADFEEDGRSGYNRARDGFEEDGSSGYN